jgi:diacylglycerol kinase (ATP)
MKVRIIANPVAGGGQGKIRAEALRLGLENRGITVDYRLTEKAGDARDAAGAPTDCIAVVGGDGTINEVINGLPSEGGTLAIMPAGSANVVAREFGITPDAERVSEWIASGRSEPMDLLEVNGHRVILGGGAGLDAAIATEVKNSRGSSSSVFKWVLPGIRTAFRYRYPAIRVIVDGETICENSPYVVVGNCRFSGGVIPITGKAKTNDGLLDVVALKHLSAWRIPGLALATWSEKFSKRKDLHYLQGKEVRLEVAEEEAAPLQIDGDPAGTIPAHFKVIESAIRIVNG